MAKNKIIPFTRIRRAILAARNEAIAKVRGFVITRRDIFVENIKQQVYPSFATNPLSEPYLEWKKENRLDERVMIRVGHYISRIGVHAEKVKNHLRLGIGFTLSDLAVDKDGNPIRFPLHVLAKVHEFGSAARGIPARPHWTPEQRDIADALPKACKAITKAAHQIGNATLENRS